MKSSSTKGSNGLWNVVCPEICTSASKTSFGDSFPSSTLCHFLKFDEGFSLLAASSSPYSISVPMIPLGPNLSQRRCNGQLLTLWTHTNRRVTSGCGEGPDDAASRPCASCGEHRQIPCGFHFSIWHTYYRTQIMHTVFRRKSTTHSPPGLGTALRRSLKRIPTPDFPMVSSWLWLL